jgi:PAS domain-containing protein
MHYAPTNRLRGDLPLGTACEVEISYVTIEADKANEARAAREDLHVSEVRYRRLFEAARDGILILDATSRRITDVNPFMLEPKG